jgi:ribosome maturation factor RimP
VVAFPAEHAQVAKALCCTWPASGPAGTGERTCHSGTGKMDLERIREAAERVARSEGVEVVDVEWKVGKQRFLRVYIDRPPGPTGQIPAASAVSGISHRDCERVSEQLSVILDVEDLVPGPQYILEISSPGLDRKLIKPADYERFVGRLAKIWTSEPVRDLKFFEGRLAGHADGIVKIAVKGREQEIVEVPFAAIRKANLVVEF